MSKNLTRKGLAFGAIVALGASLFSAAPALAADELTLAPTTGTLYTTIAGEAFSLSAGLAPSTPAGNVVQLKYQVVTADTTIVPTVTSSGASGATNEAGVTQATTTTKVYSSANLPVVGAAQSVSLASPTSVLAGTPVTAAVTAFFDANANGVLDSGEYTSATRTVKWVAAADVVTSVTISPVTVGDTTFTASATLTDINVAQLTANSYGIYFRNNDATKTAISNLTAPAVRGSILQTDGSIKVTTAALSTGSVAADTSFRADVVYAKTGVTVGGSSAQVIGSGNTIDTVARTINSIDISATVTTGAKNGAASQATPSGAGALAVTASNVAGTSFKLVATVKDNATTPAVVKGAAFKVTLGGAGSTTPTTTKKLTVGTTTYTAAQTTALEATSDADGKVTLAVSAEGFSDADAVKLTFVSQNISNVVTITFQAPVYSIRDIADSAVIGARTVAKGSTYAIEYRVLDQFADAPADSKFRLVDTITSTGTGAGTVYQPVAGGKATISTVDANTADATVTHTVNLQGFDSVSQNYVAVTALTPALPAVSNKVVAVYVKATTGAAVAKTVTLGAATPGAGQSTNTASTLRIDSTDWTSGYDSRFSKDTAPTLFKGYTTATGVTAGATVGAGAVTFAVTVSDSTLAAATISGAPVTVSGKGLFFSIGTAAGSNLVTGADSLSFLAGSGTVVSVYSHTAGKQTVTVTSGAASKTVDLTWVTVALEAASVKLGTLPEYAQTQRNVSLAATAYDKWNNTVAGATVKFTNVGPGSITQDSTTTDTNGAVAGRLTVLANDIDTATVTATLDLATGDDPAKSSEIEFGVTNVDATAVAKAIYVGVDFAKEKTVTITIDGKRVYSKRQATDGHSDLKFTQKKAGAHTVTVRVSGGIVFTERLTTTK